MIKSQDFVHILLAKPTLVSHSKAGVSKLFEARATLGNSALSTGRIKWEMNNSTYMSFIESTTFHKLNTKYVTVNYRIFMTTDS
jgi:hypothetical protein